MPTFSVVFGERGSGMASSSAMNLDNPWMAFGRPKSPHECPPGPLSGDAKSAAPDSDVRHTSQIVPFQRHHRANVWIGTP